MEKQSTAIGLKDFAKAIRELKPNDGIGYAAELTLKVLVIVWVEADEAGNISHFTPHMSFIKEPDDVEYGARMRHTGSS